jgi:hypothetical protein
MILGLPNELILLVAENLDIRDLPRFSRLNHRLHSLVTSLAHQWAFTSSQTGAPGRRCNGRDEGPRRPLEVSPGQRGRPNAARQFRRRTRPPLCPSAGVSMRVVMCVLAESMPGLDRDLLAERLSFCFDEGVGGSRGDGGDVSLVCREGRAMCRGVSCHAPAMSCVLFALQRHARRVKRDEKSKSLGCIYPAIVGCCIMHAVNTSTRTSRWSMATVLYILACTALYL